jgi:hypothetical protein
MTSVLIPPGFIEQRGPKRTWWIKASWEGLLQEILPQASNTTTLLPMEPSQSAIRNPQSAMQGGRGAVQRVPLEKQGAAIVRRYRRGGFIRHFVRDLYWDRPPRPFAELIYTETARQRGIPTVEVLAAGVEWVGVGLYRGMFITREAEGFINLWEWLRSQIAGAGRPTVIEAIARAIARLHRAGIAHADLNLTNILVRTGTNAAEVLLIDFDRARVFPGPLPHHRRERNLRRLRRSLDKLDPKGQLVSPEDRELFCQAYGKS